MEWRDQLLQVLHAIDRRLGGAVKYRLGIRYRKQSRFEDAVAAFIQAEQMLTSEKGVDHPYVVAAIIRQANCLDSMGKATDACREYRRALQRLNEIGLANHLMASQISDYIAAVCEEHQIQTG